MGAGGWGHGSRQRRGRQHAGMQAVAVAGRGCCAGGSVQSVGVGGSMQSVGTTWLVLQPGLEMATTCFSPSHLSAFSSPRLNASTYLHVGG